MINKLEEKIKNNLPLNGYEAADYLQITHSNLCRFVREGRIKAKIDLVSKQKYSFILKYLDLAAKINDFATKYSKP